MVNVFDYFFILKVNIEIIGKGYIIINNVGEFIIEVWIGDELIVCSDDFKIVYYIIKDK